MKISVICSSTVKSLSIRWLYQFGTQTVSKPNNFRFFYFRKTLKNSPQNNGINL